MRRCLSAAALAASLAASSSALAKTIDVSTYGAIAGDGNDDAAAINKAITAASAGDTVVVPSGLFDVSSTIKTKSGVSVTGTSSDASVLRYTGTPSLPMVSVEGVSNVSLSTLGFDANNNANASQGIYAGTASKINLS